MTDGDSGGIVIVGAGLGAIRTIEAIRRNGNTETITLVGGAFLAVLLVATFVFASKPKMAACFVRMTPASIGRARPTIRA